MEIIEWAIKTTEIPFLRIESRVEKASKIAIEATIQNIINRSALVLKYEEQK
tara:strand:+ start:155 stop:310 length:156 start_codon:yes stop_codon:yes gene_type:complete